MQVAVLGPLLVQSDDGPVDIRAGKERAVVEMLALAVGRPVTAGELIDGLWGDQPPLSATKTLQANVSRLRGHLPPGAIVSSTAGYMLAVEPDDVDVTRFEREIDAGRAALAAGHASVARQRLAAALELWRGEPLAELSEHPAGFIARARLEELHLVAEELHTDARLAVGDHADAVAVLEAAASSAPLRERRWAQLMVALYRSGRQADALRAFQRARTVLIEELGIEPGDELRWLEQAIIDHDPAIAAPAAPDAQSPLPPSVAALAAQPMVGRDAEMDVLEKRWRAAAAGTPAMVFVYGEAGIGKTRLLAELSSRAHGEGAEVMFGRCDPEAVTPYQPFVEAIRTSTRPTAHPGQRGAAGETLAQLVAQLDDRDATPELAPGRDAPARVAMFEGVVQFLHQLASGRPLLFCIDDVHWADQGTVLMLRYLARAATGEPLLIVASMRGGEIPASGPLAALHRDFAPDLDTDHLVLGGLDAADIEPFLGVDSTVARQFAKATAGSPLFLREVQRFRETTGRLPAEGELPEGLRHAVARRLADVDSHVQRMMQAAAVTGQQFDLAVVARAAGLAEGDAVDSADDALAAQILVEAAGRPGAFTFAHAVVRSAVLQDLSASRRAYLHQRVAEAILAHHPDASEDHAAALAYHFCEAAGAQPSPVAAAWSMTAGHRAMDQLAWESAAASYTAALEHLPLQPAAARIEALRRLGEAERASGSATRAKGHFFTAISIARETGETKALADVALAWATVPVDVRRELDEVIELLRDVISQADTVDDGLRALLLARLAFSLSWANDASARATSEHALDMARASGDDDVLTKCLIWAQPTVDPFSAADPDGMAGELVRVARHGRNLYDQSTALYYTFVGAFQRANRPLIDDSMSRLRIFVDGMRDVDLAFRASRAEGDVLLLDGKLEAVEALVQELFERAAKTDVRNLFLFASTLLYDLRRVQGRLAELSPWFDRVADRNERVPKVAAMRIEVLLAADRHGEASTELNRLVTSDFRDISPAEQPHSFAALAGVAAVLNDVPAAKALLARFSPWSGLVVYDGSGGVLGAVDLHLARLAHVDGDRAATSSYLERAAQLHARLGSQLLIDATDQATRQLLA